jgi:hypothetical protein
VASAALAVLGIILVVIGLLGGANLPLIIVGLLAVLGGGVLQLALARRS